MKPSPGETRENTKMGPISSESLDLKRLKIKSRQLSCMADC